MVIGTGIFFYIYHVGCTFNLHSIVRNGLVFGGQNLSRRQTVFFLPIDPRDESHRDPEYIDFSVPRLARFMHSTRKRHQDAVFWVDIDLAIKEGLTFYQTRSNAIILQGTLPAHCLVKVERLKIGEMLYERQYLSPRSPPKISLKHGHNWTKGNVHDRTAKLVESSTHTVQEFESSGHLDTASSNANKVNLVNEENIDFNISGVPNAMVKRSHGINVHNLIQQIVNHPRQQALQSDLQQHQAFNPFSKESKDAIMAVGNTELCEIVDVELKSVCRACLTHWSAGIVHCTCGHLMKDDTTENKKYISSVLDLFSIPNFYIEGPTTRSQGTGRKKVAKNSTQQNNFKGGVERNTTKTFTIDFSVISGSERR